MYGQIRVLVVNNGDTNDQDAGDGDGDGHQAFAVCREKYGNRDDNAFTFANNEREMKDPMGDDARDQGNANMPGYRVRKQTRDIVNMLWQAQHMAHYFMFMEDDFKLCPLALQGLQHLMRKVGDGLDDETQCFTDTCVCVCVCKGPRL